MYSNSYGHVPHNDIIKAHLCVSGSSSSPFHSHWKIMTVKRQRKVWLHSKAHCNVMCECAYMNVCFSHRVRLFLVQTACSVHRDQHSHTRNAHPFLSLRRLFRFKYQMCIYAHRCACVAFFFVSAHHFHPFYGFKINQKMRLELFCCIAFFIHSLSALLQVVAVVVVMIFLLFTIFGSSFGCEPETERLQRTVSGKMHICIKTCVSSSWKQAIPTLLQSHKTHVNKQHPNVEIFLCVCTIQQTKWKEKTLNSIVLETEHFLDRPTKNMRLKGI